VLWFTVLRLLVADRTARQLREQIAIQLPSQASVQSLQCARACKSDIILHIVLHIAQFGTLHGPLSEAIMSEGGSAVAGPSSGDRRVSRVLPKSAWVSDRDVSGCQGPECDVTFNSVKRR